MNLPSGYGETRLTLLPRDPHWAFAYWEIEQGVRRSIEKEHGTKIWKNGREILRIYDVTGIEFSGSNGHSRKDVEIDFKALNWYFRVPEQDRSYIGELGILYDGRFIRIIRSNTIRMPRCKVSDMVDKD